MSILPLHRHAAGDVVVDARRVRAAVGAALASAGAVRLLVIGPRGSAKTAVLDDLARQAVPSRAVVRLTDDLDLQAVAATDVLVVDDLHLLAAETIALLTRRAADPGASLVVATRPGSSASTGLCRELEATSPVLMLGQVSRADVLDHRSGDDALAPSCLEWILTSTGGVSWLVAAALRAHDERDCAGDPAHHELERMLAQTVAHRLGGVGEEVRGAVEHACVGIAHSASDDVLRDAHTEGLLLRDGTPVPVIRATVATGLSPRSAVERATAAYAAGDLDAAAFLAELGLQSPGADAAALSNVAAATWSARGMLAVGRRMLDIHADIDHGAAAVATVGMGEPAVAATPAGGAPSTARIASDLLAEGLRLSLVDGRADVAVATLARASQLHTASRSAATLTELPAVVAAAAAQSHGDLDAAHAVIDDAIAGRQGGRAGAARLLLWRAWIAMQRARSLEAREALAGAVLVAPSGFTPRDELLAHAVRLGLVRRYGDSASLAAAWESARSRLAAVDVDLYLVQPLTEFIATSAKLRDTAGTDAALESAVSLLAGLGEPALWANPLRWAGVQRGILVNDPESIASHAHALFVSSATDPVAAVLAHAGREWTTVLGGTVDVERVEEAAVALDRVGLRWDAARLAGAGAGAVDDRRLAARLLARARDIHPIDAARPVARPVAPTADSGSPEETSPSGLSQRELDVARLVVEGKTYAEIGAAIFISPRTAEHHIASIRRRLGATSRSDLITKLKAVLAAADPRAVA